MQANKNMAAADYYSFLFVKFLCILRVMRKLLVLEMKKLCQSWPRTIFFSRAESNLNKRIKETEFSASSAWIMKYRSIQLKWRLILFYIFLFLTFFFAFLKKFHPIRLYLIWYQLVKVIYLTPSKLWGHYYKIWYTVWPENNVRKL